MPIVNDKAIGHQKNNKAYKLFIALHLQYRKEVEVGNHPFCPASNH